MSFQTIMRAYADYPFLLVISPFILYLLVLEISHLIFGKTKRELKQRADTLDARELKLKDCERAIAEKQKDLTAWERRLMSETEILKNKYKVFQYGKEDLLKQAISLDEQKSQIHQDKIAMGKQAAKLQHEELLQLKQVNEQARSQTLKLARDIATRDYLQNTPAFQALLRGDDATYSRIRSALTPDISIVPPFDMSAEIKSSSGEIYHTTLYKCSCPDFSRRNIVCKHMFRLAMEVGLIFNLSPKRLEANVQALLDKQVKLAHEIDKSKKKIHPKQ